MGIKRFTIDEFRATYPNEDACLDKVFELRFSNLVCPKCESDKKFTRVKNRRSYQCPACGFQVYPCKDTIFEKSTTPLTYWFYAIYLQTTTRNGVAAKELQRQLDICYTTALRMSHQIKILTAKASGNKGRKVGKGGAVVQVDECYIGQSLITMNKTKRAKMIENNEGKFDNKVGVMGFVSDNREIKFEVMTDLKTFKQRVKDNVSEDAIIVTDSHAGYDGLDLTYPKHEVVNHTINEFKNKNNYHTNSVESAWSLLKRTIKGTHVHVSPEHLQKYVDEVAFRLMNKDKQDIMFDIILSHVA